MKLKTKKLKKIKGGFGSFLKKKNKNEFARKYKYRYEK